MVGGADHRQAQPGGGQHAGRAGRGGVGAGADPGDAGGAQVLERVEERLATVVERVVVGERHAVDAHRGQQLGGDRRGPEEERLARRRPALPAVGDAALEVEHEQVRLRRGGEHLGVERRAARAIDRVGDHPAEHRVAGQRDPHARSPSLKPCRP
jgi:hypothetical protein